MRARRAWSSAVDSRGAGERVKGGLQDGCQSTLIDVYVNVNYAVNYRPGSFLGFGYTLGLTRKPHKLLAMALSV